MAKDSCVFAGRDVPPSECVIPELQSPPNPEVPGPSTSIPPLFAAGPHGPELPRPKWIPSKPKCKAKAKSKVNSGAGLESVACFFRAANGSRSDG